MKKTIISLSIITLLLGGYTVSVFSNVSSARNELIDISSKLEYDDEFSKSVHNIITELNIDTVHFEWISDFLTKELVNNNSSIHTDINFKKKILDKDLKFTKSIGKQIHLELTKLRMMKIKRKNDIDYAMNEYKDIINDSYSAILVEEIFFGGTIEINEISY